MHPAWHAASRMSYMQAHMCSKREVAPSGFEGRLLEEAVALAFSEEPGKSEHPAHNSASTMIERCFHFGVQIITLTNCQTVILEHVNSGMLH